MLSRRVFWLIAGRDYTAQMDDNTLRIVLAAVLGPLFWGFARWAWERLKASIPGASRRAEANRRRREESANGSYSIGRQFGRWLGGRRRRL